MEEEEVGDGEIVEEIEDGISQGTLDLCTCIS